MAQWQHCAQSPTRGGLILSTASASWSNNQPCAYINVGLVQSQLADWNELTFELVLGWDKLILYLFV